MNARNPMWTRWLKRGAVAIAAVLFLGWLGWTFVLGPRLAHPRITPSYDTTRITEPLDELGYVDYLAALDQRMSDGVTRENNAAVLLLEATGFGEGSTRAREATYLRLGVEQHTQEWIDSGLMTSWQDYVVAQDLAPDELSRQLHLEPELTLESIAADNPLRDAWLVENHAALELLVEASHRPRLYWPVVGGTYMGMILSGPVETRKAAKVLLIRAARRIHTDDVPSALDDLLAVFRLSRLHSQHGVLVGQLCGISINSMAFECAALLVPSGRLTIDDCLRLRAELASLPALRSLPQELNEGERSFALDALQTLARGDQDRIGADALKEAANGLLPLMVDFDQAARHVNDAYDAMALAAHTPDYRERLVELSAIRALYSNEAAYNGGAAFGAKLLSVVMLHAERVEKLLERIHMSMELLDTALALEMFRLERGRYPATLDDLAPDFLAEVPIDRFNDAPLAYSCEEGGYTLYSVGSDHIDDGGVPFDGDQVSYDIVINALPH